MASCGRHSTQAQEDEQRLEERGELRLQLQFLRSMAMVVRSSWRGLRGWLRLLLGESEPLLGDSWMREVEKIF
ncbi:hypothetical protein Taro_003971 [Colocasia esculenta]|uniref:Uncharacterized protein n=1 Tax=Colocasia esculenta TaxID=4460 RepID=A0A843TL74_COLES|nr:hypothetical protein [Colocasia esculenta]